MRTRTLVPGFEAERVWGVEVLDPLERRAWARSLWQQLVAPCVFCRPLLLVYSPAAERTALRALNGLARLGRHADRVVWCADPQRQPALPAWPAAGNALCLIHRATRFVQLQNTAKLQVSTGQHVVLTAPEAEYHQLPAAEDCTLVAVPQEEPEYVDLVARDLLQKFGGFAPNTIAQLDPLERLVVEAGRMEVALPVSLLARTMAWAEAEVAEALMLGRLRPFLQPLAAVQRANRGVAFRGRWLADTLLSESAGTPATLLSLLDHGDPRLASHRWFLLQLMVAYRAQGERARLHELVTRPAALVQQARQYVRNCAERQAWAWWDQRACCQSRRMRKK